MRKLVVPVLVAVLLAVLGLFSLSALAADSDFPGRREFPKVAVYELSQLHKKYNDVVIVDARSHYEFNTLRIKGSINIPVADKDFEQQVTKLRQRTDKPIVFYCNGRTCHKSYLAAKKATAAGIKNVFAYDAGIFEWVVAHPGLAELMGKSPVNPRNLIATSKFKARLLDPDTFSEKAVQMGSGSMVLDVRDKFQRAGIGFFPGKERWAALDDKNKLETFLKKAKAGNKTLFIYDEVGKQVRWLQYALEKMGIKNYYFMNKGAQAYYASLSDWK